MGVNIGGKAVQFLYKNYRGQLNTRTVKPISMRFGKSEYHTQEQWLLLAFDHDKKAEREFAMRDIRNWKSWCQFN